MEFLVPLLVLCLGFFWICRRLLPQSLRLWRLGVWCVKGLRSHRRSARRHSWRYF